MRVAVIGAGIFGCTIALELDRCGHNVVLIERDGDIMQHASQHNHSRVHAGYHYPRSLLTCQQSLTSLASFLVHFKDAIISSVSNYYAIAKHGSRMTASEFVSFCDEAGLTTRSQYPNSMLLESDMLEACFVVDEPMFDYTMLRRIVSDRLRRSNVHVLLNERVRSTSRGVLPEQRFIIELANTGTIEIDHVVNATYAGINDINLLFNVHPQGLMYEDVTIPVIGFDMPPVGLTVMDGAFCTLMPHGSIANEFLLYHVDESVRCRSYNVNDVRNSMCEMDDINAKIITASAAYMPFLHYAKSITCRRTIRTVHENSSDARLSEIHTYSEAPGFISVLSGKISTCVQTAMHVRCHIEGKQIYTRYYL